MRKLGSSLFKGLRGPGAAPPVARRNGRNAFPEGAFYFGSTFLFARKKERWKPCAPCRGRHPGRGAAGLLVTNGGQPFGAEKPGGPVPGDARATHQKHPGGMFLRAGKRALGFVLVGERLLSGERPLWCSRHSPPRRGVPFWSARKEPKSGLRGWPPLRYPCFKIRIRGCAPLITRNGLIRRSGRAAGSRPWKGSSHMS